MHFRDKIKRIMAFDVKITTKISVLDLIMPYTCRGCGHLGELLCGCCKNYIIQPEMRDGWIVAVGRREGVLMQLVEDYKYKSVRKTAPILAELMDEVLLTAAGPAVADTSPTVAGATAGAPPVALPAVISLAPDTIVVPLPTISKHIRERGFDHTLKLARALARRHKSWKCCSLIARANKAVQVGSNAEMRKKQALTAYELAPSVEVSADKTYLLVDDISTTGASLEAAREVLRRAGAKKIFGAVVCVGFSD